MNTIVGTLILSLALSGTVPAPDPIDPEILKPHIEEDGTIAFGMTEEERLAKEAAQKAAAEQKIKEEMIQNANSLNYDYDIASYETHYSQRPKDANRNFNMMLACEAINGEIILPGEEFSYNDTLLSKRSPERDYKTAGVISGGKLVDAIGGGICQISTTLFNASLYSGMTITERRNHSLKVGYVPAGRDATCSWGSIDFCFRNDLEIPVKIEATIANGTVKIRFLSPSNPNLGKIDLVTSHVNGAYVLNRYVNGVMDYSTTSRYR